MVICYTNHALDQFLEDLLDIGIPPSAMIRLGAKSTTRTQCLNLLEQSKGYTRPQGGGKGYKRSQASWEVIDNLKTEAQELENNLDTLLTSYMKFFVARSEIFEYLEFSEEDGHYYDALSPPSERGDGMTRVVKRGKAAGPYYFYEQWSKGWNAGIFQKEIRQEHQAVWGMNKAASLHR